jgi:hypothetical protein
MLDAVLLSAFSLKEQWWTKIGGGGEKQGGVMIIQGISPPAREMVPACMVVSGNNWARG